MTTAFARFLSLAALVFLAVWPAGCAAAGRPAAGARVHHVVICWLKQPGDAAAVSRLVRISKTFAAIPGVVRVTAGTVVPSRRAIADSTFDVAVIITFRDSKALLGYLKHPRHRRAVRNHLRPLTRRVVVYDFQERVGQ